MESFILNQVAQEDPRAIFKEPIDIFEGPQEEALERLAKNLGFKDKLLKEVRSIDMSTHTHIPRLIIIFS